MKKTLAVFSAIAGCLLLAGCQADNEEGPISGDFRLLAKLVANDGAAGDFLGLTSAIDGDIAVVGAPYEDGSGAERGAVYVFSRDQGGTNVWGLVTKLVASDGVDSDYFGGSVAVSGDTIVVGAPGADATGTDMGAVYVFSRNQGGTDAWGQVKKITAGDGDDSDYFGVAVGLDGDTLAVGADLEDSGGGNAGAAYVFYRAQGGDDNWGEVVKLTAASPAAADQFGFSIAVQGDVLVAGVPGRDGSGTSRGSACVFSRNQGGADAWGQVAEITAADAADENYFGYAVSVWGDTVVVGSPNESSGATNGGAAYVFSRNAGGTDAWGQIQKFASTIASAQAGVAVAVGETYAAIGAKYAGGGGTQKGEVYVLAKDEGGTDNWGHLQTLRASGANDYDVLGYSVGVSGVDIIAGAPGDDDKGEQSGSATIFEKQ